MIRYFLKKQESKDEYNPDFIEILPLSRHISNITIRVDVELELTRFFYHAVKLPALNDYQYSLCLGYGASVTFLTSPFSD
jgi:hypothetical protein